MQLNNLFSNMQPTPMLRILGASAKYAGPTPLVSLGIGEPDQDTDPRIVAAADQAARQGFTHYPPVGGFPDLKAAIAKYWKDKYGLEAGADNVIVGAGATQAIHMIMAVTLNPGDEVIIPSPFFGPYQQAVEYVYGKVVTVDTHEEDGFNITAEALEKAITPKTKMLLLNSPGNPTGSLLSREEALKICEVVKKHNLILMSDEVYEAFLFEGAHTCLATLPGMNERTFTIGSFSKTYAMCGWRVGYAIGPVAAINAAKMVNIGTTMGSTANAQKAALFAIENCNDFARDMVVEYKKRRDYVVERANSIKGLSCRTPKGAFYAFINIRGTGLKSMDFSLMLLEKAGVVTMPGVAFGQAGDDYIRVAYTIPIPQLKTAFDNIEKALNA